ncbi:hypothetical protein MRX96_046579 [Rhipicephalus microplus]
MVQNERYDYNFYLLHACSALPKDISVLLVGQAMELVLSEVRNARQDLKCRFFSTGACKASCTYIKSRRKCTGPACSLLTRKNSWPTNAVHREKKCPKVVFL